MYVVLRGRIHLIYSSQIYAEVIHSTIKGYRKVTFVNKITCHKQNTLTIN